MLNDFFDWIDEAIINTLFQPICNSIRKHFGWSKRVPASVMKAVAIIGTIPVCGFLVSLGGMMYLLVTILILWILGQVSAIRDLIHDEMLDGESEMMCPSFALDEYRVKGKNGRKFALILSLFVLPFVLAAILTPKLSYVASFLLVSYIADLCDSYFRACIDLPKGKSVFARIQVWIRNFAKQSMPQAT